MDHLNVLLMSMALLLPRLDSLDGGKDQVLFRHRSSPPPQFQTYPSHTRICEDLSLRNSGES